MSKTKTNYETFTLQQQEGTINTEIENKDYRNRKHNYLYSKKPKNIQAQYKIQYNILKRAYQKIQSQTNTENPEIQSVKDALRKLKIKNKIRKK
jgi:hypothetical protein